MKNANIKNFTIKKMTRLTYQTRMTYQTRHLTFLMLMLVLSASALFIHPSYAQQVWPQQPVTLVVGYAPGGTTDIIARIIASTLTAQTGQTFIVENKAGASSNIGAENVASSAANGTRI